MRSERLTRNENLFREVDGRIGDADVLSVVSTFFICECDDGDCREAIEVSFAEYAQAHSQANRFLVAVGHTDSGHERLVRQNRRFAVVEVT